MKKSTKILTTAILAAVLSVSSFAAGSLISITVDPTVKIKVNGSEFKPKDVNGNDVMTFIYNGTTYAPLRALAEAYGLEVGYDAAANMATVDEPGNDGLYFDNYDEYTWDDSASGTTQSNSLLWDNDIVSISYSRCYADESWLGTEYNVEFIVENKTDRELTFQMGTVALDGFSYEVSGSDEVAANAKGHVRFYTSDVIPLNPSTISGKISVIDFSELFDSPYKHDASFNNVQIN